jgi:hypothetical protein
MYYDIIGDLHGHAEALVSLLEELGYREKGGVYSHPESRAVFVGDFIDRGPEISRTLAIVRSMVESGAAISVLGNHEYNAICFNTHRSHEPSRWLRSRDDKNIRQHLETLYQFRHHEPVWRGHLAWFRSLPLYLDLGPFRVVHAAWHAPSIELLSRSTGEGNRLTCEFLLRATRRGNAEFDAIQNVLKGVEIELPGAVKFVDKDGHPRKEMRVRWWLDAAGRTYRDIAIPSKPEIDDIPVSAGDAKRLGGYHDPVPVFIGHYWLEAPTPSILAPQVACLDFSVAKGGYLAAYRYRGEAVLTDDHFVIHR